MAKFQSPIRSLPPLLSNGCKRLRVSNLNRKSNWKELKQLVRRYIDIPHVDCNNKRAGEGYIECYNHSDCKHLYNRLNGVRFEVSLNFKNSGKILNCYLQKLLKKGHA